ncbi:2-C-methyl-D-erythritol 2,4-cyclodiphosphate synthase [Fictibacillus macauensis ZFHKF-1]|uniref:2-C-methyl-D-erythritol 2,4-cyclodiphosphate synthase n=1 Tax=Fictibacillus macauensis ZFHKF-1 TaxID=1196324 RepID=I8IX78_9BACL|nr:2-C-methyl-D-erythritol 2,4-cyclodiphosphate synthase [Fictibacillus macauensis]EIT84081.1 2-C-methyl-D-erythritol 2,4-cyclodiphosphate synthase [Fictibacillus macauensis ZFHKF-1]
MIRVGQGYDVHQLVEGRPLIIGGVTIPFEKGLLGHSDADVLLHTITDAFLGAAGEGDIGKHFPDTDAAFKDADSKVLLKEAWAIVKKKGYELGNVDCTIIAQKPKMAPYIEEMRGVIASLFDVDPEVINVKATTTEKLGFTGREEGIAANAVVLITKTAAK